MHSLLAIRMVAIKKIHIDNDNDECRHICNYFCIRLLYNVTYAHADTHTHTRNYEYGKQSVIAHGNHLILKCTIYLNIIFFLEMDGEIHWIGRVAHRIQ